MSNGFISLLILVFAIFSKMPLLRTVEVNDKKLLTSKSTNKKKRCETCRDEKFK